MPSNQHHRIEKLVGSCEDWHEVGATGEPAFENSWVNFDTSLYPACSFYKDQFGVVHLKGLVKSGIGVPTTIFTLPEGYRPDKPEYFATTSSAAFGDIRVTAAGAVRVQVGSTTWVSLAGVSFRV